MSVAIGCLVALVLLSILVKVLPSDPIQDEIDDLTRDLEDLLAEDWPNPTFISAALARIRWLENQKKIRAGRALPRRRMGH